VGGETNLIGIAEARSALGWWLEAGVDVAIQEEPRNWLKPESPRPQPGAPIEPRQPADVVSPSRETLVELQQWLASSIDLPLAGANTKRVAPHGPEQAAIMLLSDAPTLEDAAAGQPIGGAAWELAKNMLRAIGLSADQAYSASLTCFHAPGARMTPQQRQECAELAREHIRLAAPKRLLLLGDGPAQALLGKPLATARGHVHHIDGVRTVTTFHPRHLINQPSNKALAWKDLLLLMEDES
jgi:uracil-DNA glycosylase family 4